MGDHCHALFALALWGTKAPCSLAALRLSRSSADSNSVVSCPGAATLKSVVGEASVVPTPHSRDRRTSANSSR